MLFVWQWCCSLIGIAKKMKKGRRGEQSDKGFKWSLCAICKLLFTLLYSSGLAELLAVNNLCHYFWIFSTKWIISRSLHEVESCLITTLVTLFHIYKLFQFNTKLFATISSCEFDQPTVEKECFQNNKNLKRINKCFLKHTFNFKKHL